MVLPSIISNDQYGFMAGKQAADLIELTREIIEDAKAKEKNLSIFAIDFSGAFDNVSYKAIIDALYRRGFGPEFHYEGSDAIDGKQIKNHDKRQVH